MGELQQYSQVIAPFKRVTNAPLETDFMFASKEKLVEWANNNKAVIYNGMQKCVYSEDSEGKALLSIYAFILVNEKNDEDIVIEVGLNNYLVKELISSNTLDEIFNHIDSNNTDLSAIRDQITAIWGTINIEELDENLNSIMKLIDAVKIIRSAMRTINDRLVELTDNDKAISGSYTSDIIGHLATLKFKSITDISTKLEEFFDTTDITNPSITTWVELSNFLAGMSDSKPLKEILDEITGTAYEYKESDSIIFHPDELKEGIRLSADVKISSKENNQIIVNKDGLYYSVDFDIEGGLLQFKVNGNIVKVINLAQYVMSIKDISYDPATETIVITFTTALGDKITRIPFSMIIREWDVENVQNEPVKLDLKPAVGEGKDKLSAVLAVDTDPDNIVQKTSKGIAVIGRANNIKYNNTTVHAELDKLQGLIQSVENIESVVSEMNSKLEGLIKEVESIKENIASGNENFRKHIEDTNNPHAVTYEQVGTYSKEKIDEMHSWTEE